MRELSLHILDLIENSVRAGASVIAVSIAALPESDMLRIAVEDNGPGLEIPYEKATDPFYTTKAGKRTGLGLSLMRGAAERAGGRMMLGRSELGGLAVTAELGLLHVDRAPIGDLAGTLSSLACTNPDIDFRFAFRSGPCGSTIRVFDVAGELAGSERGGVVVAQRVMERIQAVLEAADGLNR